ncbi:hypothetical protein [Rhodovulum sp. MB263]|uniref:hypothetical protein n=1 Tax=Rhodovulum sp. (strain MB263) TaxID=308754 RepID=UPI0012DB7703|nr:hypothetical protein [Rhodovulum sp. MB263]
MIAANREVNPACINIAALRLSWAALIEVLGVVAFMCVAIGGLHLVFDIPLLSAVMIAAIIACVLWTALQARQAGGTVRGAITQRGRMCRDTDFVRAIPEIASLGAAGFMAAAVAPLLPQDWLEAVMGPLVENRYVLYPGVAVALTVFSAAGLNPLVAASLIAGTFTAIPSEALEPNLLAFSLAAGWGVAFGASPFTTGSVVLAGALGVEPAQITLAWNGLFTIVAMTFVVLVILAAVVLTERGVENGIGIVPVGETAQGSVRFEQSR